MEYILKVSPKGQVAFPKKMRETLEVKDLIGVKLKTGRLSFENPIQ